MGRRRGAFHFFCILLGLVWSPAGLAAGKTFTITTENYPPYVDDRLSHQGWAMALARAILEPQGYEVILNLRPWARAMYESRTGQHDALYLAFRNKEREAWYVFSEPIAQMKTGLFKLKERPIGYATLQDLRPYLIGLTRGAAVSSEFDQAEYLRKEASDNDVQGLKKLLRGRIDLFAGNQTVLQFLIDTEIDPLSRERLEFIQPPLAIQGLHMAVSRQTADYQRKLDDFNRGLRRVMSDGTYQKILRDYGIRDR